MKAITIWQPWATLLPLGIKLYETRSWATSYRGPIAIHAAALKLPQVLKRCFPGEDDKLMFLEAIAKGMKGSYTSGGIMDLLNGFPTSSIVATARLIECHKISSLYGTRPMCFGNERIIRRADGITFSPNETELMLGDWTPGRYAWEFADMKAIPPIPARGKQWLWEWDGGGRNG